MELETLQAAMELAKNISHVFVATTNAKGLPHVATAAKVVLASDNQVAVREWFCPGTVRNVSENPFIALVVWDAKKDEGYQLLGAVDDVKDLSVLDGYAPGIDDEKQLPQIERQLLMRVDQILEFTHRPHSDIEA